MCGLPEGLFARWTVSLLTYSLKPSYAGEPRHIPLREFDGWTYFKVKLSQPLVRPEGSEFGWASQPPTAFHDTRRVPGFPY